MRIIIRRENPHPGAQLSLFEQHEGKRYQVTATSTPRGQIQFPGARHRTQARVEDKIRCAKSTGLGAGGGLGQGHHPAHAVLARHQGRLPWHDPGAGEPGAGPLRPRITV
jgi:hypothetical protein